jgi:hypothetical protein
MEYAHLLYYLQATSSNDIGRALVVHGLSFEINGKGNFPVITYDMILKSNRPRRQGG